MRPNNRKHKVVRVELVREDTQAWERLAGIGEGRIPWVRKQRSEFLHRFQA